MKTIADLLATHSMYCGDCIVWTGALDWKGYGKVGLNGQVLGAHRVAYKLVHGDIPDGLQVNHLCRNRACINPGHLNLVTSRENTMHPRSESITKHNAEKTHCLRGHPFTQENTYRRPGEKERECRTCRSGARREQTQAV